jgi:hypothetical protein
MLPNFILGKEEGCMRKAGKGVVCTALVSKTAFAGSGYFRLSG